MELRNEMQKSILFFGLLLFIVLAGECVEKKAEQSVPTLQPETTAPYETLSPIATIPVPPLSQIPDQNITNVSVRYWDDIRYKLETNKEVYALEEPINITNSWKNVGNISKDILVKHGTEYTIFNDTGSRVFTSPYSYKLGYRELTLNSGEEYSLTDSWDQKTRIEKSWVQVPPGYYKVAWANLSVRVLIKDE